MRQITEVLRLNAQGLSYRQIAQSVGISASTVQSYVVRAQRAELSWLSSAPAGPVPIRAAWSYHAEQFGSACHSADMQLGQLEHQPVARAPGSRSAASRTVTSVRRCGLVKRFAA